MRGDEGVRGTMSCPSPIHIDNHMTRGQRNKSTVVIGVFIYLTICTNHSRISATPVPNVCLVVLPKGSFVAWLAIFVIFARHIAEEWRKRPNLVIFHHF